MWNVCILKLLGRGRGQEAEGRRQGSCKTLKALGVLEMGIPERFLVFRRGQERLMDS
jgi:hypothetical protein